MALAQFLMNLPSVAIPLPGEAVSTRAMRSDHGLIVFFLVHRTTTLPEHFHKGQWGTVIEGQVDLTVNGQTTSYRPGMSYDIPSGAPHSAVVHAGSVILDVFEEADRYPLVPRG